MKDSGKLLELARRAQQGDGANDKYTTLMIANALAIVARQNERTEDEDIEEPRGLARDIRAGNVGLNSTRYDSVYQLLCDQARQNVLISNPGYLDK